MNIKQLFFVLLSLLLSINTHCSDEYKKQTSITASEKAPNTDQDIEVAFMVTTIAPLAQTGHYDRVRLHALWEHYEANNKHHKLYSFLLHQGRHCYLHIPHNSNESIGIMWKRNQTERENNPLNWLSKQTDEYYLKADRDNVSLSITGTAYAKTQALFTTTIRGLEGESSKVFSEFNPKDIHKTDFLTKRYESYLKLYAEKQKEVFLEKRHKCHLELCAEQEKSKDK